MFSFGEKYFSRTIILLGISVILSCILAIQIVLSFEFFFYSLLYKSGFLSEGAYFVIFTSFALSIVTIRYFKFKIYSDNWELLKTSDIQYSIDNLANNFQRVTFLITYHTLDGTFIKSFQFKQKTSSEHVDKVLRKKLVEERSEALVYFDPVHNNHSAFKVGFSYFDFLLALVVVSFQISLMFGTILLVSLNYNLLVFNEGLILDFSPGMPASFNNFMTKLFFILTQNLIGYFLLVSICLTVLILVYLFKGLHKSGFKRFSNYPMFYDVRKGQIYDLVHELKLTHTYCLNCGQIISLTASYCPICLAKQLRR